MIGNISPFLGRSFQREREWIPLTKSFDVIPLKNKSCAAPFFEFEREMILEMLPLNAAIWLSTLLSADSGKFWKWKWKTTALLFAHRVRNWYSSSFLGTISKNPLLFTKYHVVEYLFRREETTLITSTWIVGQGSNQKKKKKNYSTILLDELCKTSF